VDGAWSGSTMSDWQKILKDESIATLDKLHEKFGDAIDVEALKPAFDNFQMRITPHSLASIKVVDGVIDSLDEDGDSPVPNITHRYPDRALFLVSPVCASYCRFCTRRRKVGDPEKIPLNQYDSAFEYLRQHTEIRDVIMSGGDPMMLSDRRLEYLFQQLRAIPHIEIIRIGSRITSHLPERITPEFCEMVAKYHPIFMNVHFNHPDELTPAAVASLDRLSRAGVSLGCQTVLLKGVNDDPKVMMKLMHELLKARVRPYYIFMADQVAGGEHFRTTVQKGLEIIQALRGWTSGLAVPQFVIDSPGGGGKVPLLPEYVEEINDDEVVFRNYEGKRFSYKQPKTVPAAEPLPAVAAETDVVPILRGKTKKVGAVRQRRRKASGE
jgi:lysine 2,3-aminomutase